MMKSLKNKLKIESSSAINNNMSKFNEKYEEVLENFSFIKTVNRSFYPKNFKLSEGFVKAFRDEYKRLIDEGNHPRKVLAKINKALLFHTKKS